MNASFHTPAFRPVPAEASFAPAFRESPRQTGYGAARSYTQRRYTARPATPRFRCS